MTFVLDASQAAMLAGVELTVDDLKASTKPWAVKLNQIITLDTDLLDYICNGNQKDIQHLVQK